MSERSAYVCPCCREFLYVGRAKNVVLHACGGCRGIWLDRDDALRLFKGWASQTATAMAKRVDAGGQERVVQGYRVASQAHLGARHCPRCRKPLKPHVTQTLDGTVEVDACLQHGAWFDRHELVRLAEAARELRDESAQEIERYLSTAAILSSLELEIDGLPDTPAAELGDKADRLRDLLEALRESVKP